MVPIFEKELFSELLETVWFAAKHTTHYCFHDGIVPERYEERFHHHAYMMRVMGEKIGLREEIFHDIKYGAWNAGWWTANKKAQESRLPYWTRLEPNWLKIAQTKFIQHFENVRNYGQLDEKLVTEIQDMCKEIGFYTNRKERGEPILDKSNSIVRHCLKICPKVEADKLRDALGIPEAERPTFQQVINSPSNGIAGNVQGNQIIHISQSLTETSAEMQKLLSLLNQELTKEKTEEKVASDLEIAKLSVLSDLLLSRLRQWQGTNHRM